jgi:hypothetical protein
MRLFLLGLYTARLELFKFFFFFVLGVFVWSIYLFIQASGSSTRKRKKKRALLFLIFSGIVLILMAVSWLLSRTNVGWWFEKF